MLPEASSWRTSLGVIDARCPVDARAVARRFEFRPLSSIPSPRAQAFSAALYIRPATPELLPVASEEHEMPVTERSTRVPKFVQPLSWRYDGGLVV